MTRMPMTTLKRQLASRCVRRLADLIVVVVVGGSGEALDPSLAHGDDSGGG